jgi:hypothetical protein
LQRGAGASLFLFSTFERLRPNSLLTGAWIETSGRGAGLI